MISRSTGPGRVQAVLLGSFVPFATVETLARRTMKTSQVMLVMP
jgi:hypothetical protein